MHKMRALSIRQPYAEMILRGDKKHEYRNVPCRIIREPFYIYASKTPGAKAGFKKLRLKPGDLPTGVLVGKAEITSCSKNRGKYKFKWRIEPISRLEPQKKPLKKAQPIWFYPF